MTSCHLVNLPAEYKSAKMHSPILDEVEDNSNKLIAETETMSMFMQIMTESNANQGGEWGKS